MVKYLTKEAKTYNGVKTVCSINGDGKIAQIHAQNKTRPAFAPHKRINSKMIKDLNLRLKIIKFLEESTGSKILDISLSNIFSDISHQARETKDKLDYI